MRGVTIEGEGVVWRGGSSIISRLLLAIAYTNNNHNKLSSDMKGGTSFLRPPTEARINIDLQLNLFNTWLKYDVAEYYQHIFLTFLDEQGVETVEKQIKREIKQTIEKNTLFFKIENLELDRQKQIRSLEQLLKNKDKDSSPEEIGKVCEQVSKLRNINLQIAQNLLKMFEKFRCYNYESQSKQTPYYETYFDDLDKQNKFIKDSILNRYIKFNDGYDPFLMEPYQQYHRSSNDQQECIKKLYNLNISYVYRLIKTKNNILEIRSKFKQLQSKNERSVVSQKLNDLRQRKEYEQPLEKVAKQPITYQKYPAKSLEIQQRRQSYSQINHPIKIAPIKVYPSSRPKSKMSLEPVSHEQRAKSPAFTDKNYELVFSRVSQTDSLQGYDQRQSNNGRYRKQNKVYLTTETNQYESTSKASRPSKLSSKFRRYAQNDQSSNSLSLNIRPRKLQPIQTYKYDDETLRESPINKLVTDNSTHLLYEKKQTRHKLQIVKQFQIKETVRPQAQRVTSKQMIPRTQKPKYTMGYDGEGYEVKHYNPIKKNQFQLVKKGKLSKYDFVAGGNKNTIQPSIHEEQSDNSGLSYERPIFKYNKKDDFHPKKRTAPQQSESLQNQPTKRSVIKEPAQRKIQKTVAKIERVQQQCQTIQEPKTQSKNMPQNEKQPSQNLNHQNLQEASTSKQAQSNGSNLTQLNNSNNKAQQTVIPNNSKPKRTEPTENPAVLQDSNKSQDQNNVNPITKTKESIKQNPQKTNQKVNLDQTLQNQDIIYQRKSPEQTNQQPPIRTSSKKQPSPQQPIQDYPQAEPKSSENNNTSGRKQAQKKEIKMKVGKSTLSEIVSLLKTSPIKPQYKTLFGLQRLMELIKVNQTYLTEFHVNNVCAIIALSSPITGIGMALKLWAPIHPAIDDTISSNLFTKYIEHIEKSTTSEKIMFSGNGQAFKELKNAEFTMKKENLYERIRKNPAKDNQMEFKPFLYVECSTVNFNQNGNESMLFSEEIEQFNDTNCHFSNFIAKIDKKTIPKSLQPLIKIDYNLNNFEEVNKVLTSQNFDNYEAGDMKISSINLLRFYLNTHFKGNFVACEGHFQFMGNVHYEKGEECLASIQTSKNNGVLYFAKKMSIKTMIQKCSLPSNTKSKICVKMFHKVLYGKLPKQKGCYANWEINLTWEDQMQGKVKHPLPQGITFGSQGFYIGLQVQKQLLYCAQIKKEDFIY